MHDKGRMEKSQRDQAKGVEVREGAGNTEILKAKRKTSK